MDAVLNLESPSRIFVTVLRLMNMRERAYLDCQVT